MDLWTCTLRRGWIGLALLGGCARGEALAITGGPDSGLATATDSGDTGPSTGTAGEQTVGADAADSSGDGDDCVSTCDGECIEDVCCPLPQACTDVCCGEAEVCSFRQCVTPGAACVDATECPDGNYCEYSLGEPGDDQGMGRCQGGFMPATGKCLPEPPECPDGAPPPEGETIDCLPQCEVIPETSFSPVLKYHWSQANSMMAPIVLPLDDDNCDDIVDERDIPEIVFTTFEGNDYSNNGTLHAISVVDGAVVDQWSAHVSTDQIQPGQSIAGANIDATAGNEIVVCTNTGRVRAFDHDGTELWISQAASGCSMPTIADLDQDGLAEIIVEAAVLDGATGLTKATFPWQGSVSAADIDGDGQLEIVGARFAYEADGTQVADSGLPGNHAAVADLDGDGNPEVAVIDAGNHTLQLWRWDPAARSGATVIRQGININGMLVACPGDTGGGPPTIADFNNDGTPDVGVAAGVGYAVFDGAALMTPATPAADTLLWITPATDCSSRQTGSSVFDFDGNGAAEVVYGDEQYLRIYDGSTGAVVFEECNTTGTLIEYPLVADVDNDGHADIIVISNDYSEVTCPLDGSKQRGLRIFGDDQWVRTRRIWNQHPYHVTNVEEDGSIPMVEPANWTVPRLNNFRQNVQPEGEFAAPDLVPKIIATCKPDEITAIARVRNLGRAAVPAGVPVTFYEGDPAAGGTALTTLMTTKALYPAEAQDLSYDITGASAALLQGEVELWVVVDEGAREHPWQECQLANNRAHKVIDCGIAG